MSINPQTISLTGLNHKQSLVIAFDTVKALGWRIRFLSDAGVIAYTNNGEFSWNGEITIKLDHETASVQCVSTSGVPSDYGQTEQAVQRYVTAFEQVKNTISDEEVDEKFDVYEKDFIPPYEDTLKPDTRPRFAALGNAWSFFKPTENYFFTPLIVNVNILIWIIMVCTGISIFDPTPQSVMPWGANVTDLTLNGQWWRLLTNCFIHFGIIHLALNMYALVFVGLLLEPFLGKTKYLTAYLLTGIVASLASLWWHDYTVSAGASGAIFGLYGVFLAILSTNHVDKAMRNGLLVNIGVFVVYNLVYGSLQRGIDNAAHLGGLLSGIVVGYLYLPALRKPDNAKLNKLIVALTVALCLAGSAIAYVVIARSDRVTYIKRLSHFYEIEDKAIKTLNQCEGKPNNVAMLNLQKGISYWHDGSSLITQLDRLDVSTKVHHKNELLLQYCRLRVESYQLMYTAAAKDTSPDMERLNNINAQIKHIIDELSTQ